MPAFFIKLTAAVAAMVISQPTLAAPEQEEIAAVMTVVMRTLAGDQAYPHRRAAGRAICVAPMLGEAPLVGVEEMVARDAIGGAAATDAHRPEPAVPPTVSDAQLGAALWPIDEDADADKLAIQVAAVKVARRRDRVEATGSVDKSWLAPNQSLDGRRCDETQRFSLPAIEGGYAFVNVTLDCGLLCGLGALYVLRRTPGGWTVVAAQTRWVS